MVNKFWALFGEDGVSYSTAVGTVDSNGVFNAPDNDHDWVEVSGDINSSSFWKKNGELITPLTQEELQERNANLLNASLLFDLRLERKKRLDESDWTQFETSPLSAEKKTEWAAYRQALRDLPNQVTDIRNVTWPVKPS